MRYVKASARQGAPNCRMLTCGEVLSTTSYMGGGPSLVYAANAATAFDDFSRSAGTAPAATAAAAR